ncbi:MAG: thiamine phosphate synthase [Planctomycetota bacterium]
MTRDARRMLDANCNRASEAARTAEDIARFVLDDGPLAGRFKSLRQAIDRTLSDAGMPRSVRTAARDTAQDAGVANSAADLHSRDSVLEIASAAGSRLTEALRVIEETLKLDAPSQAAVIERLRYDAYTAERLLLGALSRPSVDWPVCVLITESLCTHHSWQDVAAGAIEGGAACLQLREKSLGDRELVERARVLIDLARPGGVAVVVNDHPAIAALVQADGVHVGQSDLAPADVRRIVGERVSIGVSCSTTEQARDAVEAGADVIGVGAMYGTTTKANPTVAGPSLLRDILADATLAGVPHLAIGGVDASRAQELAGMGCRGVAISNAVCSSPDPAAATAAIVDAIMQAEDRAETHQGAEM